MKYEILKKISFADGKGVYFSVPSGEYKTEDEEEIRLLERSRYAKKVINEKKKPKGTGSN